MKLSKKNCNYELKGLAKEYRDIRHYTVLIFTFIRFGYSMYNNILCYYGEATINLQKIKQIIDSTLLVT